MMKKLSALLLVMLLLLGLLTPVTFAALELDVPTEMTNPSISVIEHHPAFMRGDSAGLFRPQDWVTRAEVAAILVRTHVPDFVPGELPAGMEHFDTFAADVDPSDWFYPYVAWAYHAGLMNGSVVTSEHPYRRFRPHDFMRRDEIAVALTRTQGPPQTGDISEIFTDWEEGPVWSRPFIYTVYRNGWMVGSNGQFRPMEPITRAELATVVNRMLGRVDGWRDFANAALVNSEATHKFPDVHESAWYYVPILVATNAHELRRDANGAVSWIQFLGTKDSGV